jgi:hypothetical protein
MPRCLIEMVINAAVSVKCPASVNVNSDAERHGADILLSLIGNTALKRLLCPRTVALVGGQACAEVIRQSRWIGFEGELWPVLVEKMIIDPVAELIVGFNQDPIFGWHLALGSGGTLATRDRSESAHRRSGREGMGARASRHGPSSTWLIFLSCAGHTIRCAKCSTRPRSDRHAD